MNKKISFIVSFIGIIGFIIFQTGNKATDANGLEELPAISEILQAENIMIHEWSLYAREKMDAALQDDKAKELMEQFPDWEWSTSSDAKHKEYTAISASSEFQETIQLVSNPENHQAPAYVIYEVKGPSWGTNADIFLKKEISERMSDIFRGNATIFSCIKGKFNDKIETALPDNVNRLLKAFNGKEIEALKEDKFISVSAYSPHFTTSIKKNNDRMNLQIAVRNDGLGDITTVVVGTPIITIEY
jgi:TATA-box binding